MISILRHAPLLIGILCSLNGLQAQYLSDAGAAKGGGTFSSCDTSLTVDFEVVPLGGLAQQFNGLVVPGNTIVGVSQWTYFTDELQQMTGDSVQVTFPAAGEMPVCLSVAAYDILAAQPCSTTTCRFVEILQDPSCLDLNADFGVLGVIDPNTIVFELTETPAPDVSVIWNVADGFTTIGNTPQMSFSDAGPHEICVTLVGPDPINCTATICKWLYLGPGQVDCSQVLSPGFLFFQNENIVVVVDTSTVTGQNSQVTWDFGDGTTAQGRVAVHFYDTLWGGYELCANVDAWGPLVSDTCAAMQCMYVQVGESAAHISETGSQQLRLWPNPAVDELYFEGLDPGPVDITIWDGLGREVHTGRLNPADGRALVPVGKLVPGIYTLRYQQNGASHSGRFVKE